MAAVKRKIEGKSKHNSKPKRVEASHSERPTKRARKDVESINPISLLQQEEARAFPRGGGDVLTPLERKQVQIQATRDVLFEDANERENRPNSKFQKRKGSKKNENDRHLPPKDLSRKPNDFQVSRNGKNERRESFASNQKPATNGTGRPQKTQRDSQNAKKPEKTSGPPLTIETIAEGKVLSGRVSKTTERSVIVQLSSELAGRVSLMEMADDYDDVKPEIWKRDDRVSVRVLRVIKENMVVLLSMRPSKVFGSNASVKDKAYSSFSDIRVGDMARGFIKNVTDAGVFVALSSDVDAFVHLSDLSDSFLKPKEWKNGFALDKLVKGRITIVDESSNRLQMSLKDSIVDPNYKPLLSYLDLKVGEIITGKLRNVKDFGAFVVVDNSYNVSGLCHRSEMADAKVEDARELYSAGDLVKAKILTLEPKQRKISFGLKASYLEKAAQQAEVDDEESIAETSDDEGGIKVQHETTRVDSDLPSLHQASNLPVQTSHAEPSQSKITTSSLKPAPFDFSGTISLKKYATNTPASMTNLSLNPLSYSRSPSPASSSSSIDQDATESRTKKKKHKPVITTDHTLTASTSLKTPSDFERHLLSQRDDASLWLRYMAYHMSPSPSIDATTANPPTTARDIAERALREISDRAPDQKLIIWIAYLNLEIELGNDDSVDALFARACQYSDALELHKRLASCYIQSAIGAEEEKKDEGDATAMVGKKLKRAEEIFKRALAVKEFRQDESLFLNYAQFLFASAHPPQPQRARDLLHTSLQSLPSHVHRKTVLDFATLEFKAPNGSPEHGRTIFEGLFESYKSNWDHWDVLVQLEGNRGDWANVRRLYERMTGKAAKRMKEKRARKVFERWEQMERENEDGVKGVERVRARKDEYLEGLRRTKLEGSKDQEE